MFVVYAGIRAGKMNLQLNYKTMIKYKILFETKIDVESDDYDDGLRLAKAEADRLLQAIKMHTKYKYKIRSINPDLSEQMIKLKTSADEMIEALKNLDK